MSTLYFVEIDKSTPFCYSLPVKQRVLRFISAVALGLMLFDDIADAAGCQDSPGTAMTACHACSCGSHVVPQYASPVVEVLEPTPFVCKKPSIYALILPQLIFHPPAA